MDKVKDISPKISSFSDFGNPNFGEGVLSTPEVVPIRK